MNTTSFVVSYMMTGIVAQTLAYYVAPRRGRDFAMFWPYCVFWPFVLVALILAAIWGFLASRR